MGSYKAIYLEIQPLLAYCTVPLRKVTHWPKTQAKQIEAFRIDYLIRTPNVEKLSLQPVR